MSFFNNKGTIDSGNTSTTVLSSGLSFSGTWYDVSSYDSVIIAVATDQNGTILAQFSPDSVNIDSTLTTYYKTSGINPPHRYTVTRKYFRVVFTNTSASGQTYFRLETLLGSQSMLNLPTDSTMSQSFDAIVVRPTKFEYEVALSRRQGATSWNKFGYNPDLDIGTEVIAAFGGTFTPLLSATTLTISSSSINDDGSPAGTGANTITIYGIDSNRDSQTEIITMNGTTSVITSSTWLGVNRAIVTLAGSGLSNIGLITITATSNGSTQATIPIGEGATQQAIFFTLNNNQFLADYLTLNVEKTGSGASPKVRFKGWVYDATTNSKYLILNQLVDSSAENTVILSPSQPYVINENSVLWFEGTSDVVDTFVGCRFSGIQIRDVNY